MKCICGRDMIMSPSNLTSREITYDCSGCGEMWVIYKENMCICGAIDKYKYGKTIGEFVCTSCGESVTAVYSEQECYIEERQCNGCRETQFCLIISATAYKCIECSTLQESNGVYTFVRDKHGNLEIM